MDETAIRQALEACLLTEVRRRLLLQPLVKPRVVVVVVVVVGIVVQVLALISFVLLAKPLSPQVTRVSPVLLDTLAREG